MRTRTETERYIESELEKVCEIGKNNQITHLTVMWTVNVWQEGIK